MSKRHPFHWRAWQSVRFAFSIIGSGLAGRRMPAEPGFERTNDLMFKGVEGQRVDRRPPDFGDPRHRAASPSKVQIPWLLAWIEQPHRHPGLRVARHLPRSLAQRAMNASQREVGERRRSAGDYGHDMIDMKRRGLPEMRKTAVFAPMPGARRHAPTKTGGNSQGPIFRL